ILGLTFTNKAAREMQQRLAHSHIGHKSANMMTFHRIGLTIFQKFYKDLGFRPGFTLIDHNDRVELIQQLRPGWPKENVLSTTYALSRCKQESHPQQAALNATDRKLYELLIEYDDIMLKLNSIDIDDLILHSVRILQNPDRQKFVWDRFDYIFVDEFQDTNTIQYALFYALQSQERFTLVGDDDQSIYTWRGANPQNFAIAQKDFPNLQIIKLEQNFRCNVDILNAANRLIANNSHVYPKKLWSKKAPDQPSVWLLTATSKDHEIESIIADFKTNSSYGHTAILLRTNYQMIEYEKALKEERIDYDVLGGTAFFQRPAILDLISYFRLILNPDDNLAFKRIINIPKRNIGPKKLSHVMEYSAKYNTHSLLHAIQQFRFLHECDGSTSQDFSKFNKLITHYQKRSQSDKTLDWIDDLLLEIDYMGWLEQNNEHPKAARSAQKNVSDFIAWIKRSFIKTPDLKEILRKIMLSELLDQQDKKNQSKITLATIHAVKGLEFDQVYIAECLEQIIPHKESESNIEEERRLMYVGMTRAKKRLVLSHSQTHRDQTIALRSRFLDEIGNEFLRSPHTHSTISDWSELQKHIQKLLSSNHG
ncbi:MAG: hypothetical protein FJ161_02140, partial [Gammaproteobacteria bacterium]|nr:hypothetical protein [Gammaproteobacteria bacterium]